MIGLAPHSPPMTSPAVPPPPRPFFSRPRPVFFSPRLCNSKTKTKRPQRQRERERERHQHTHIPIQRKRNKNKNSVAAEPTAQRQLPRLSLSLFYLVSPRFHAGCFIAFPIQFVRLLCVCVCVCVSVCVLPGQTGWKKVEKQKKKHSGNSVFL